VIIAVAAEHATGSEAQALKELITRAWFAGHTAGEVAADSAYASENSYAALDKLKTTTFIAPRRPPNTPPPSRRARMHTRAGRDAAVDRQAHAEGCSRDASEGLVLSRLRGGRRDLTSRRCCTTVRPADGCPATSSPRARCRASRVQRRMSLMLGGRRSNPRRLVVRSPSAASD
jgi:hypothetical protein